MGRRSRARHRADRRRDAVATTGTHRAVGRKARRRVAAWPVACVILLGLLVMGWFGWNWADGVLKGRAAARAADCAAGDISIQVVVAPVLERPVEGAAQRWNQARTVVQQHCVRVDVRSATASEVYAVLTGETDAETIGGNPTAWLPDSTRWLDALNREHPELMGSSGLPVARGEDGDYPFLALAGPEIDDTRQHAAQSFQKYLLKPAQQNSFRDVGLIPVRG